jgi:predicted unusual protein kinase regulating ubiquinone biosynthesis (AarF/ABC1/UbiB family)
MEFCPGLKLTDKEGLRAKGFSPEHLANTLTNTYLEQICRHGFFHCDPHPGNLAVDDGFPGGRLIYYDFGMMERVSVLSLDHPAPSTPPDFLPHLPASIPQPHPGPPKCPLSFLSGRGARQCSPSLPLKVKAPLNARPLLPFLACQVEERVKKGFVDLVFAIYENTPTEACNALEEMGVLRQGVDRFSIERIAKNMLNTFESTLSSADNKWENEMTPEQRKASRRARRAQLGQDLFATQADKPFLLPPKFTFVFRAFSTIDGIGKSLIGPKYDLSRIAQPYMRELADLKDGAAWISAARQLGKRLGWRPIDVAQLVTQPRKVAGIASTVQKIGDGDLRLRVRTLEVERMLERVELRQHLVGAGLTTAVLMHISLAPFLNRIVARVLQLVAAKAGWEAWKAYGNLRKLEMQRLRFANADTVYDEMT